MIYGLYNDSLSFLQGFRAGLIAFTAAVMGGIGNIQGAFAGRHDDRGHPVRLRRPHSAHAGPQAVVFALLIVIMIFRPTGLLGEETGEAG